MPTAVWGGFEQSRALLGVHPSAGFFPEHWKVQMKISLSSQVQQFKGVARTLQSLGTVSAILWQDLASRRWESQGIQWLMQLDL